MIWFAIYLAIGVIYATWLMDDDTPYEPDGEDLDVPRLALWVMIAFVFVIAAIVWPVFPAKQIWDWQIAAAKFYSGNHD